MILAFIGSLVSKIGQGLFSGPEVLYNNIIFQLNSLNSKAGWLHPNCLLGIIPIPF